ncbi:unnamed protein product [Moneuplotes crassus]|uniref:Histidine kinase n=2 Tax=Euplotes crassus TaxID=5936 RepID=A0AAD1Y9M8_EUPCR|nr:unnamed protein product [Moneuplotes crassus]
MEIDQKRNLEDYLSQDLMDSRCRVACKSLDGRDLPAEKETEPEGVWKFKDYVDFAVKFVKESNMNIYVCAIVVSLTGLTLCEFWIQLFKGEIDKFGLMMKLGILIMYKVWKMVAGVVFTKICDRKTSKTHILSDLHLYNLDFNSNLQSKFYFYTNIVSVLFFNRLLSSVDSYSPDCNMADNLKKSLIHDNILPAINPISFLTQEWATLILFILVYFEIVTVIQDHTAPFESAIEETRSKLLKFEKIVSKCPTPLIVTTIPPKKIITSQSGRSLIENFNLFKKKEILKTKFLLATEEEDYYYELKDIILLLEQEGFSEARLEKEKPSGGYLLRIQTFEHNGDHFYAFELEDITDIKEGEEEKALNKFKSVMFASMTHEIRTPLNAIINSCDVLLMNQQSDPMIKNCAEICKSSASLLMYMSYNILDYCRMETGEFREERIPFFVFNLLNKIALISEPHAKLKNLIFELEIEDEFESLKVENDERRIIQVLLNLIMNAVKYTTQGKVRLRITQFNISFKIDEETIEKFYLLFTVADTGDGISEDKQSKLFTLFGVSRGEDYTQSTSSGLGLAVAQNIISNIGGCLCFFSKENRGSIFTFAIPLNFLDQSEEDFDFTDEITMLTTENLKLHIMSNIEEDFEELMADMYEENSLPEREIEQLENSEEDPDCNPNGVFTIGEIISEDYENSKMRFKSKSKLMKMADLIGKPSTNNLIQDLSDYGVPKEFEDDLEDEVSRPKLFLEQNVSSKRFSSALHNDTQKFNIQVESFSSSSIEQHMHKCSPLLKTPKEESKKNLALSLRSSKSLSWPENQNLSQLKSSPEKDLKLKKFGSMTNKTKCNILRKRTVQQEDRSSDKIKKAYQSIKVNKRKSYLQPLYGKDIGNMGEPKFGQSLQGDKEIDLFKNSFEISQQFKEEIISEAKSEDEKDESKYNSHQSRKTEKFYQRVSSSNVIEESEEIRTCGCAQILIVDDNAFNSQVLFMMIKSLKDDANAEDSPFKDIDIKVDMVFDGYAAIDQIKKRMSNSCCKFYKIIFMDINMPKIDGFETTKLIWKTVGEEQKNMVVIALTAMPWSELSDDLEEAGIMYYIQKPIDKDNLETVLQKFIN